MLTAKPVRDELERRFDTLKDFVERLERTSPFYRSKFRACGFSPQELRKPEDFRRLPFTTKEDLRDAYPLGLQACPEAKVVRIHSSSGTTGHPVIVPYTQKDVLDWQDMMRRCYELAGVTAEDRVQVTPGYGLWTAGIGFQLGAEALGAMVIPTGPGNTERQLQMMIDLGTTVLTATSSYALLLGEEVAARGLRDKLRLRVAIIGSERFGSKMRRRIEDLLGVETFDIYGLTEVYGPGIGIDCHAHLGLHLFSDYLYAEIVDPETLKPLPEGEQGELVLTAFAKEGAPLLRFRTRDITTIRRESCPCGCPYPTIDRVLGRTDDMFKIKGVNCFPAQVEAILKSIGEVSSEYQIILFRDDGKDEALLRVESQCPDNAGLASTVVQAIREQIGVGFEVELMRIGGLPRSEKKTRRVLDERNAV